MAAWLPASFGGVEMLLASMSGDTGVDWAVISPHRGDTHTLQNQGRRLRRVQCEVLFCDQPGLPDPYLDRYRAFEAMGDAGTPQIFVHPIHGSYLAVIDSPSYDASADELAIRCQCSFIAMQEPVAVQSVGAGIAAIAGPEDVGVRATAADAELAALDASSATPAECLARAEAWANGDTADAAQVLLEVATLTSQIDTMIATLDLLSDYSRWAAYKALIHLRYSVTQAASAATSEASQVVDYRVRVATPLRSLCARLYGARLAEDRAGEVTRINGIRIPGLIAAGTLLKVPSEGLAR